MERMKSLKQLCLQYWSIVLDDNKSKRQSDKAEHAFVKTVREMKAALGVPGSKRIPLNSSLYNQLIEVGSYYGRTI